MRHPADLHRALAGVARAGAKLAESIKTYRQRWGDPRPGPGDLIACTDISVMGPFDGSEDTTRIGYLASWATPGMAWCVEANGRHHKVSADLVRGR